MGFRIIIWRIVCASVYPIQPEAGGSEWAGVFEGGGVYLACVSARSEYVQERKNTYVFACMYVFVYVWVNTHIYICT